MTWLFSVMSHLLMSPVANRKCVNVMSADHALLKVHAAKASLDHATVVSASREVASWEGKVMSERA